MYNTIQNSFFGNIFSKLHYFKFLLKASMILVSKTFPPQSMNVYCLDTFHSIEYFPYPIVEKYFVIPKAW